MGIRCVPQVVTVQQVKLLPLYLDAFQGERLGLTKFNCYRTTRKG